MTAAPEGRRVPSRLRARAWLRALPALAGALLVLVLVLARSRAADVAEDPPAGAASTALPTARGLPIVVRTALQYVDVSAVDENAQTFTATVDLRLRWEDAAQRGTTLDVRGDAVDAALATMWAPEVELENLAGDPTYRERGLIVEKDGTVELLERTRGTFATPFRVRTFPFDRHPLQVHAVVRGATIDDVTLDFLQDDVAFSHADPTIDIDGWTPRIVDLDRAAVRGFRGEHHAGVRAGLWVERDWTVVLAPVFIPLFSALLIPLLAIWLNRVDEEGGFAVDAFELANVLIGGLFAIIALNFTVNGAYTTVAAGDNTVTRLFALNYLTLGVSLVIDIALFRFGLIRRWFGRWIQEQVFLALIWAVPALSLGAGIAIVAAAACG